MNKYEEAAKWLENIWLQMETSETIEEYEAERATVRLCFEAIKEKAERENTEPLTIEKIKHMYSGHVYVKSLLGDVVRPALIHAPDGAVYINGGMRYDVFQNYGKTWLAYLHLPKEDNQND